MLLRLPVTWLGCAFALCNLLSGEALAADGDDTFYRGKQIRLVVSTDVGGAYDTYARIMAPVLREHIPGNPVIIVQNMPGAGGLKAANYMAQQAPRDGTMIASTHAAILTLQYTSPGATNFDAGKFSWIGSITNDPFIGYVWHTSPIRTLEDTKTIASVMGGVETGSASTDYAIMARDMFGLKFRIVSGYKNSPDVKLAMERGEVDGTFANGWSSVATDRPEWIRDKKIRIIVQHGFRRHPDLPEVPLFSELARSEAERQAIVFMMARQEAAKPYFAPPDLPKERLALLRRAFDDTVRDPKFTALASKAGLALDGPMTGDEVAALVGKVAQTPSAVVQSINRMLSEKK
jgi:tripartite-type tricarboxylate transporter receptor subunit TctC